MMPLRPDTRQRVVAALIDEDAEDDMLNTISAELPR